MLIHNKIAVVVPVYSAEKILDELCSRLTFNLSQITDSFEIILVDDSSSDSSWNKIKENTPLEDQEKIKKKQLHLAKKTTSVKKN